MGCICARLDLLSTLAAEPSLQHLLDLFLDSTKVYTISLTVLVVQCRV